MSKRFIDTGIFDDEWFMDLSKDAKLLWMYFITKCDHAGMIKVNNKLCRIQTDIKDLPNTYEELGNRIVTVSEGLFFIPKYLEFQYPGFPNSKVRAQISAVEILKKYNLFDGENLTLTKELPNSYVYVHVNDNDNKEKRGVGKKEEKEPKVKYAEFVEMLKSEHDSLVMNNGPDITEKAIAILDNYKGSKGVSYKSDYRAILSWVLSKAKENKITTVNTKHNAKPVEPTRFPKDYNPYDEFVGKG